MINLLQGVTATNLKGGFPMKDIVLKGNSSNIFFYNMNIFLCTVVLIIKDLKLLGKRLLLFGITLHRNNYVKKLILLNAHNGTTPFI